MLGLEHAVINRVPHTNHVPLTILIVDDNSEDREAARLFLSEAGSREGVAFGYCEAVAGKDGLAAYRSKAPDCILLDYYLPDMNGLEFLAQIMNEAGEVPLPVVMLTGAADRMLAAAALCAGAQEYLPKRFMGPEMLIRAVQSSRSRFSLIAERRRSEAALAAGEKMLRLSQEAGGIASFEQDFRSGVVRWAAGSQTLLGFTATQTTITSAEWLAALHPADAARVTEELAAVLLECSAKAVFDCRMCRSDSGVDRQIEVRIAVAYDASGQPICWNGAVMDVTEQRAATQALSRINDELDERVRDRTTALLEEGRRRLETEALLHEAHKMEAIGQLTGGISHDFNNLLQTIIGNTELVQRRIKRAALAEVRPSAEAMAEIGYLADHVLKAALSGAQLTHRLLAFARRQKLETGEFDVNSLVGGMSDMIRQTVGIAVTVAMRLTGDVWPAFADSNQLEAAILNLVVNARDAMPSGGQLSIETANAFLSEAAAAHAGDAAPGHYVMLKVTDTGMGIDKNVIEHVFEPFFTTKDVGRGTGLGLAMVYGFAKQSLGGVRIESEAGQGTSVVLYLPRAPSLTVRPA